MTRPDGGGRQSRRLGYWPAGVAREESIANFIAAFGTLGYEIGQSGHFEAGVEKIAIFSSDGTPTHVARQLPDGSWTSQLGTLEDIAHVDVHGVAQAEYGVVEVFLKRAR